MSQGKLEVVKQEMARVNINILGISELKWMRMDDFNSDDHYISITVGKNSIEETEVILSYLRWHTSTVFQTSLLIMRAIPFLVRDFCPH